MVYLSSFKLMSKSAEENFIQNFNLKCFDTFYPLQLFSEEKHLETLEFSDITILCGNNGSGKSTILNVIAEKLQLKRETPFNRTYFFGPYLNSCKYQLEISDPLKIRELMSLSRIITSDDVFNHIIGVRKRNEDLGFKRDLIMEEKKNINLYGWTGPRPKGFSVDDPDSMKVYSEYWEKLRLPTSKYVRKNVGVDERTYSNGENGFKYFTDAIQPGGLYLLDEPENSLSPEMQLELVLFIQAMARFYDCQFIISTHSPFILSLQYARIYDLDSEPIDICRWTELNNVRIYYDFFKRHSESFEKELNNNQDELN